MTYMEQLMTCKVTQFDFYISGEMGKLCEALRKLQN